jgi:flagellin-like protein
MKKGITPVISIVILLLITIALAGMAWTYLQSVFLSQVEESIRVPSGGIFCEGGRVHAYVTNLGTHDLPCDSFTLVTVNNQDASGNHTCAGGSIPRRETQKVIDGFDCGSGCGTGYVTVRIGTSSTVVTEEVYC